MEGICNLPKGFAAIKALGNAVNVRVVGKILEEFVKLLWGTYKSDQTRPDSICAGMAASPAKEELYSSIDATR
jgi:hypothetical protein